MRTYYDASEWGARLPPPGVREARFAEQFTIPTLQAITFGVGVGLVFGAAGFGAPVTAVTDAHLGEVPQIAVVDRDGELVVRDGLHST